MNWTPKEFTDALVEIQWIQYHYRYDKEIADACDLIYKRITEDRKRGVRMTEGVEQPIKK